MEAELAAKGREPERRMIRAIAELADIHFVRQQELKGLGDAPSQRLTPPAAIAPPRKAAAPWGAPGRPPA